MSYVKLSAPPSPSQLPRRRRKQRGKSRAVEKSPVRSPVRNQSLFDEDCDLNQKAFSRPRRPSRTLPSRIPPFADVEVKEPRSQSPPERRSEMSLMEIVQHPSPERRPPIEVNRPGMGQVVRRPSPLGRRPPRHPARNRYETSPRDVQIMDRRSRSSSPEQRPPQQRSRPETAFMDVERRPHAERRPPEWSKRNRIETRPSFDDDGDWREAPMRDDLLPQRNVQQNTRISKPNVVHEPEPERPKKAVSVPEARRGDRDQVLNLLKEILETEIRYLNDLRTLKEFYHDRMMEMAEDAATAIISLDQTRICLLDPTDIIAIHQELLMQFSDAFTDRHTTAQQVSMFCAIFNDTLERFRWPYTNYLAMFASSTQLLTRLRPAVPAFNSLLEGIRMETDREISSLLILPVQRLPRYALFLDRIEQHTPGSRRVVKAKKAITELIHDINAISSATSPLEKLQWEEFAGHINLVSASRVLIRTGDCRLLLENTSAFWTRNARSTPAAVVILCNDAAVFATRTSGAGLRQHSVIALRGARVSDMNDDGDYRNLVKFQGCNSSVIICCDKPSDKSMWLDQFQEAIVNAENSYEHENPDDLQVTISVDLLDT